MALQWVGPPVWVSGRRQSQAAATAFPGEQACRAQAMLPVLEILGLPEQHREEESQRRVRVDRLDEAGKRRRRELSEPALVCLV